MLFFCHAWNTAHHLQNPLNTSSNLKLSIHQDIALPRKPAFPSLGRAVAPASRIHISWWSAGVYFPELARQESTSFPPFAHLLLPEWEPVFHCSSGTLPHGCHRQEEYSESLCIEAGNIWTYHSKNTNSRANCGHGRDDVKFACLNKIGENRWYVTISPGEKKCVP